MSTRVDERSDRNRRGDLRTERCERNDQLTRRTHCHLNGRTESGEVRHRTFVTRQSHTQVERREDERNVCFDDVLDQERFVPNLSVTGTNRLELRLENPEKLRAL